MNRDLVLLNDIAKACSRIADYISGGEDRFNESPMIQDAVIRNLEIIGEAVKNLSNETKLLTPNVPWRRISGMRDKLIHQYFGVNLEVVWSTASTVVPSFLSEIDKLRSDLSLE